MKDIFAFLLDLNINIYISIGNTTKKDDLIMLLGSSSATRL